MDNNIINIIIPMILSDFESPNNYKSCLSRQFGPQKYETTMIYLTSYH